MTATLEPGDQVIILKAPASQARCDRWTWIFASFAAFFTPSSCTTLNPRAYLVALVNIRARFSLHDDLGAHQAGGQVRQDHERYG